MQFESWAAFWHMGGYGFYVWLAFGVSLAAMGLLVIASVQSRKQLVKQVAADLQRKQRIAEANQRASQAQDTAVIDVDGEQVR